MATLQKQIERIFAHDGLLAKREGFEHRPQQEEMALAIASTLEAQEHLLVEAPTGIGKSLAYLVPSLLFALENRKKALIATHTKNLQEQLWHNDLALVRSLIPLPVSAALLKGRRNYLCTTRLRNAVRQPRLVFEGDRTDDLARLVAWAEQTQDGDLDTVPFPLAPEVRTRLSSEPGVCNSATCGPDCFFQRAKRLARGADLVIVNHALFFTLLPSQQNEEGYLYPNDFVVIDEGHMLEQTAGLGLSRSLSCQQVLFAIHRLFNPRTRKGLLARQRGPEFREQCERAAESAEHFFAAVAAASRRVNPAAPAVWWKTPVPVSDQLSPALRRLDELVAVLGERKSIRIPQEELLSARRLLQEAESTVSAFLLQEDRSSTYWVELPPGANGNVTLFSAPTSAAESVGPLLFKEGTSAILTSATLAVGSDLSYCQQRFGAEEARTLRLDSPFNYYALMRIVITPDIPQPDEPGYEDALPNWILRSIHRSHGRALVLFTNASLMRRMAERLRGPLAEEGSRSSSRAELDRATDCSRSSSPMSIRSCSASTVSGWGWMFREKRSSMSSSLVFRSRCRTILSFSPDWRS